ncbi:hypothetical protein [Micromonospora sp. NPDC049497]|uniref:hypothetical protein n=1 Tax=Micromonospora sp. NPDC049497 TaxID=3364273 RepID=UPI0037A0CA79
MAEQRLTRVPFYVEQASYCVGLHERATCPHCVAEGCPTLEEAREVLAVYRADRARRYGLDKRPT